MKRVSQSTQRTAKFAMVYLRALQNSASFAYKKIFGMELKPGTAAESAAFLRNKGFGNATVGVVLGTGLGALAKKIANAIREPYGHIPGFPEATVESHKGNLLYGKIGDTAVLAMQGRFHYYEGYSLQQITFPIRVMKELGVQYLFLSNAAGGLNKNYKKGDIVLLKDHINLLPDNPLRGLNDPAWGERFVDMSEPYSPSLMKLLNDKAAQQGTKLKAGVYVSVMGPNLETRAEYRWLHSMGADMVGMSTVPEVIVAKQLGMQCAAVSVITDECDPDNLKPVNISEIIEVARKADQILSDLLEECIKSL